ncbi:alpha/beta fold hydrolase [Rheinheimera maricola]|uniref:Alpha/beta hydrolase n=1 Tax=Rheinheimera maricola TaxID=2793282 RepID=A0ABS7XBC8_9GAMM|nr:alpha/beta hydrolase [Rheinheimera maricola]MBZ9612072.1 alpha/beta hydrolase [Rheinheimera maricola]
MQYAVGQQSLAALSNRAEVGGQPVLCLHGWLDNAASFMPLAAQLPHLSLLAVEFPGHGHSSHRSSDAHYYFFDWVQDIVALCRQQQWQQLTIIGHSMGAMVATALAASFPELVAKLVLIDSLGFVTDDAGNAAKQLRDGITSRLKAPSRKPYYASLADAAAARQKQSDFSLTEAMLLAERGTITAAPGVSTTKQGVSWRADMRLRHNSVYRLTPEQAKTLTSAVQCKVLGLIANDSSFSSKAERFAVHYRQLQLAEVSGGHHCHMTQAAVVAQHIQRFLTT